MRGVLITVLLTIVIVAIADQTLKVFTADADELQDRNERIADSISSLDPSGP